MARVYISRTTQRVYFTNDRGVGVGMANERPDVMLIQFLLQAVMLSGRPPWGRPGGPVIQITGIWDEASRNHLARWELIHQHLPYPKTLQTSDFPGKMMPLTNGGRKILDLNTDGYELFGSRFTTLEMPNATLPLEVRNELFFL
jgi:hypothetical protein